MNRESIDSVLRSLRRVNLQGSFFGQTVAIRFGLTESDIEALEVLIDAGASTAGRLSELMGLTTEPSPGSSTASSRPAMSGESPTLPTADA